MLLAAGFELGVDGFARKGAVMACDRLLRDDMRPTNFDAVDGYQ